MYSFVPARNNFSFFRFDPCFLLEKQHDICYNIMHCVKNQKKRMNYTMSASNEKKTRTGSRAAAEAEEAKKNKKFRRNTIIVIIAIVVLVAASLVITSDIFYTRTTAVSVGSTKYSPAEVNYFYKTAANQLYQQLYDSYGETASSIMDLNKPLSQQYYYGDMSWAQMALQTAEQSMEEVAVYYDAAVKEGRTLSAVGKSNVESSLTEMQLYASMNGYKNLSKFLAAYFGKGMSEKLYTKIQEKVNLAAEYSSELLDSLTYTDEELAAYYDEHADDFNYQNYYAYPVNFADAKFDDVEGEKADAAHAEAEKIAAAKTVDAFIANVRAFTGDESTDVTPAHTVASSVNSNYADWINDPARVEGDTTVIDTATCSYALMYVGIDDNDYNTVDMRHILINAEADEIGEYTDEALEAAKARCEELLTEWQADPTSEHFAEMANEYSEDSGSNTNGGLYSTVIKNQMVPEINAFLFADGRAAGDAAVVLGQSSAYTGYHVVYCDAIGENLRTVLARNSKTNDDFNAVYASLKGDGYAVAEGSGMKYASVN